ncbi:MAG TPA: serine/threonine-protein kinase [Burkholderiaceae bacterium]|nr:serine/threonine-protein kinase [Burkholderiaceae bacterium]
MSDPGFSDNVTNDPRVAIAAPSLGARSTAVLPVGARVNEFEILDTIGEGGFGIVYRAHDHSLRRTVALKEYMPTVLAARSETQRVSVKSGEYVQTFLAGLRSFINEAQLLAQFDHPALVKVHRFCEANGTAYMAMPLYEGGTLKQALRARAARGIAPPDEVWLRALVQPLLDALALLHRENCLHRDVAPDNILLLGGDGPQPRPLLLDFGAARRVIGEQTQALTVILKPGYAPIEQYDESAGLRQGPWTDVYALAAVLHSAITGKPPPQAVGRLLQDAYAPLAGLPDRLGRYGDQFLAAIDRGLAPLPQDRPQDIAALRALFGIRQPASTVADPKTTHSQRIPAAPVAPKLQTPRPIALAAPRRSRAVFWGLIGVVVVVALFFALKMQRKTVSTAPAVPTSVPTPEIASETSRPLAVVPAPVGGSAPGVEAAKPASDPESVAGAPNWVHENLRAARQCLVAKRYTCTIERAEEVLKSAPTHPLALRLARLGREGMQGAAAAGRKKL